VKAITLVAPGELRRVDDWPEPVCGPNDVVVQVRGVGLCGSDLSVYDGKRAVPQMPWVMGHEGGGDIVAIGSEVTDRQVGQRVIIEPNFADLTCEFCQEGQTSACVNREILAINRPGLLAERVAAPAEFTWPVPDDWGDVAIACFEPLAVAHTAVRRSGVKPGDAVLVVGAGSQGLLVCQCLVAAGAQVYFSEPHEGRRALAEKLGARPAEEYEGDGYPFVFETAGVPPAWAPSLAAVRKTGTLVMVGFTNTPLEINTLDVVQRQLTLKGQLIYNHPDDFAATIASVSNGEFAPAGTVQAEFPVDDASAAFASARTVPGKSWLNFADWRA
jgi:2-desacetyl-2-hydroxyethyl bacteriochlorophyllide A dehydrogenase